MMAYLLLQLATTGNLQKAIPPLYKCWNGAKVTSAEQCPRASVPPPMTMRTSPIATPPVPIGSPGNWISSYDYPTGSLRQETEGLTSFALTVGEDGRVAGCMITQSSGDPALDLATCTLITRRARFHPALDTDGNPIVSRYANRVRWQIPEEPSYVSQINSLTTSPLLSFGGHIYVNREYPESARALRQGGEVWIAVDVSEMGRVRACTVTKSSGFYALDTQSCLIAKRWSNYLPAYDANGRPIGGRAEHIFKWIPPKVYDTDGRPLPKAVSPTYIVE